MIANPQITKVRVYAALGIKISCVILQPCTAIRHFRIVLVEYLHNGLYSDE